VARRPTRANPAPAGAASGESGEALNPITFHGFNWPGDLAVWTLVVFLVVLAILWRFAWGPIRQGLSKREQEIAGQIAEAQRTHAEARELLAEYERKLAASKEEVRGLLEAGRRQAEQLARQTLDQAKQDAAGQRQRALEQIESATAAALKDHARLIEEAVAEFVEQGGNGKK
jgi:F-type H+-transporting ATPase subunit b